MTLMPRMVNGAGIQGLRLVINAPEGSSFILPSKALVSYYRGIVDKYLDRTFNCTERDLRIKGDALSRVTPQKFLEVLFKAYNVHTIDQRQHIFRIRICIDGRKTEQTCVNFEASNNIIDPCGMSEGHSGIVGRIRRSFRVFQRTVAPFAPMRLLGFVLWLGESNARANSHNFGCLFRRLVTGPLEYSPMTPRPRTPT